MLAQALAIAACALAACSKASDAGGAGESDAGGPAADASATARLDGQILRDDKWLKVVPPIMHDAKMDLATRCLLQRDDAKAHGDDIPVCYDQARKPTRAVTTIVVERDQNMASAMKRLTAAHEAVHFVIEHNGGIYQVLDLAYVARHHDAYPEGEVRVVSCNEDAEKALVATLQGLYPGASVATTDLSKGARP